MREAGELNTVYRINFLITSGMISLKNQIEREHTFVEKLLFAAFLLRTSSSVRERGVSVL